MDPLIQAGVAFITGAGSGLGQAMAIKFAEHGCTKLFLVDIAEKGLHTTQQLIQQVSKSAQVVLHVGDISNEEAVKSMVSACVESYGRLDFAMNNAGIALGGIKTADMPLEMFDKICNINEKGTFLCMKHEIVQMLKQEPLPIFPEGSFLDRGVRGSIVNTASISGLVAMKEFPAYLSSKHAVAILTKQTAREYAPYKIRINAVCPGIVNTPGVEAAGLTKEFRSSLATQAPMNRWIHAAEVSESTVFLSSSRASAITGTNLPVDCGATLYHLV